MIFYIILYNLNDRAVREHTDNLAQRFHFSHEEIHTQQPLVDMVSQSVCGRTETRTQASKLLIQRVFYHTAPPSGHLILILTLSSACI